MKAHLVSESINFERGIDPKESMNLGLRKKLKEIVYFINNGEIDDFDSITDDKFTIQISNVITRDFMIVKSNLESDFIITYNANINIATNEYRDKFFCINPDLGKWKYIEKDPEPWILDCENNDPEQIAKLIKGYYTDQLYIFMGNARRSAEDFIEKSKLSESINFERGKDPKTSMGLGSSRIPKKGEKFIAFYGPKTGWIQVTALEDPTNYEEITSDGNILAYEHYKCWTEIPGEEGKTIAQYWTKDPDFPEFSNKWWLSTTENYTYRKLRKEEKEWEKIFGVSESQNFERGIKPTKAMKIGLAANPIIVDELIYKVPDGKRYLPENPSWKYSSANDEIIKNVLEDLENGIFKKYPFWHYHDKDLGDVYYYQNPKEFVFTTNIIKLEDIKGKYVQHNGILYKIPLNIGEI